MYANRDAAREANKEVTEKAAARNAKPAEPAAPAASADPLGQAIASMEAKPPVAAAPAAPAHPAAREAHPVAASAAAPSAPAAAPAAAAGAGEYVYYLQAGAFRDVSDAEATRAKLALLGFEAAISDRTSDSGVLHRVRIGPYNQVEPMNKARAKLLDSGVDVAIVRNQR
jgi:cell division protein FtsN